MVFMHIYKATLTFPAAESPTNLVKKYVIAFLLHNPCELWHSCKGRQSAQVKIMEALWEAKRRPSARPTITLRKCPS